MRVALETAFSPTELHIVDESRLHQGHAGHSPHGETHYSVRIRSGAFAGLNRVDRHRLINEALKAEFASGLHALAIQADTP